MPSLRALSSNVPRKGFCKLLAIQKAHSGPRTLFRLSSLSSTNTGRLSLRCLVCVYHSGFQIWLCLPPLPHLIQIRSSPFSTPLQAQELTFTVTWMGSLMPRALWCPVRSSQWKQQQVWRKEESEARQTGPGPFWSHFRRLFTMSSRPQRGALSQGYSSPPGFWEPLPPFDPSGLRVVMAPHCHQPCLPLTPFTPCKPSLH